MADPVPFVSPAGRVVRTVVHGEIVHFLVNEERDSIQKHHLAGIFYEKKELEIITRHFPIGGSFVDIGANVGNHSLYVAKFLHARHVLPIEINPIAYETLIANIHLNNCLDRVDLTCLGIGISDKASTTASISNSFKKPNLGGCRVSEDGGDMILKPADVLIGDRPVDFIKIDVEGMEMKVLDSLFETISRCRPSIFIEVDRDNQGAFEEWVPKNGFRIAERLRHRRYENFMLVPMRKRAWDRIRNELSSSQKSEAPPAAASSQ